MSPHIQEAAFPSVPLRIAAAQARAVRGDVEANVATVERLVREAAARGAGAVVFPEKFLSGYEPELIASDRDRYAVSTHDPRLAPVARACRETRTCAVVGAAVREDEALFISALVFGRDGAVVTRYDKQFLFGGERQRFRPGASGCTLSLDGWRLGLGICYDSGFPEHARAAARDGCHAYLVGALFSVGNGHHESRTWFPARALDNTCYALLSNHVGVTGGWNACGASAIWGPDGRLIAEAGPDAEALVVAELDPERLRTVRAAEPLLQDLTLPGASAIGSRAHHRLD